MMHKTQMCLLLLLAPHTW